MESCARWLVVAISQGSSSTIQGVATCPAASSAWDQHSCQAKKNIIENGSIWAKIFPLPTSIFRGGSSPGTVEAQNFALFFFPLPPPIFVLFLSFSGGLLVEFWWCLKRRDLQPTLRDPTLCGPKMQHIGRSRNWPKSTALPAEGLGFRVWGQGLGFRSKVFWHKNRNRRKKKMKSMMRKKKKEDKEKEREESKKKTEREETEQTPSCSTSANSISAS